MNKLVALIVLTALMGQACAAPARAQRRVSCTQRVVVGVVVLALAVGRVVGGVVAPQHRASPADCSAVKAEVAYCAQHYNGMPVAGLRACGQAERFLADYCADPKK